MSLRDELLEAATKVSKFKTRFILSSSGWRPRYYQWGLVFAETKSDFQCSFDSGLIPGQMLGLCQMPSYGSGCDSAPSPALLPTLELAAVSGFGLICDSGFLFLFLLILNLQHKTFSLGFFLSQPFL